MLYDWSGHSQWMNSKALKCWALPATPDRYRGFLFYRDEDGNPPAGPELRSAANAGVGAGGQFNADKLWFLTYLNRWEYDL